MKGYTGEGFLSEGKRLGGQQVPLHEARRRARAAAEKRRTLTAGSGQKLGGAPVFRGTHIRKVTADAAQRRIDVTKGCASGTSEGERLVGEVSKNGFTTKAEEDDDANDRAIMQAYIELIQEEEKEQYGESYAPPSAANPAGPRSSLATSAATSKAIEDTSGSGAQLSPSGPAAVSVADDGNLGSESWACPVCTLVNPETFLCCNACGSERPQTTTPADSAELPSRSFSARPTQPRQTSNPRKRPGSAIEALAKLEKNAQKAPIGWVCHSCSTFMESHWWTCSACGTMKRSS